MLEHDFRSFTSVHWAYRVAEDARRIVWAWPVRVASRAGTFSLMIESVHRSLDFSATCTHDRSSSGPPPSSVAPSLTTPGPACDASRSSLHLRLASQGKPALASPAFETASLVLIVSSVHHEYGRLRSVVLGLTGRHQTDPLSFPSLPFWSAPAAEPLRHVRPRHGVHALRFASHNGRRQMELDHGRTGHLYRSVGVPLSLLASELINFTSASWKRRS